MMEAELSMRSWDQVSSSPLHDRKLTRLYCKNGGHHLQLLPDGTVRGSREEKDPYSKISTFNPNHPLQQGILRVTAVSAGVVVIEGIEAKRFLSMNDEGKLNASASLSVTEESYFLEKIEETHYNTYQSQKYGPNWYVGLKKNGEPKRGSRTHIVQEAIFFLSRRVD